VSGPFNFLGQKLHFAAIFYFFCTVSSLNPDETAFIQLLFLTPLYLYTHYGRENEQKQEFTLQVAEIEITTARAAPAVIGHLAARGCAPLPGFKGFKENFMN
jgi:hypothetical protein